MVWSQKRKSRDRRPDLNREGPLRWQGLWRDYGKPEGPESHDRGALRCLCLSVLVGHQF